jgi:hypothetical protein
MSCKLNANHASLFITRQDPILFASVPFSGAVGEVVSRHTACMLLLPRRACECVQEAFSGMLAVVLVSFSFLHCPPTEVFVLCTVNR